MPVSLAGARALPTYLASNGGVRRTGAHATPLPDLGAMLFDPAQHSCHSAAVPSQLPRTTSNLLHPPPIRLPLFPPSFCPRYTHIDLAPRGAALHLVPRSCPFQLWEDSARAVSALHRAVLCPQSPGLIPLYQYARPCDRNPSRQASGPRGSQRPGIRPLF